MVFLPDGRMLITEKAGTLELYDPATRTKQAITGVPAVVYGGQGGFGDIALHPNYASNHLVYISYAEAGTGGSGAAVARATLNLTASGGSLSGLQVIWRQSAKYEGQGHYGHRLLFSPDGKYLFISSGERQQFTPAQDMTSNLGKIVRVFDDGSLPPDNPFQTQGTVAKQIWSLGHRNPLGLAFDANGQLWEAEMGPQGGDELNLIVKGQNYGWPVVSNGDNYDGTPIPDHATQPQYAAPKVWWTPVISPARLMIYNGPIYTAWKGNAFLSGLSSTSLVRVTLNGTPVEAQRWNMGQRLRSVTQDSAGYIWLLEDGASGRLLKLVPAS